MYGAPHVPTFFLPFLPSPDWPRGLIALGCKTERRRSVAQPLKSDLSKMLSRKYDLPYTEPKTLEETKKVTQTESKTLENQ